MNEHNEYRRGGWRHRAHSVMVTMLLLAGLAGCGGGEAGGGSGNAHDPSPVGRVSAVDGFGVARPNVPTRLDLSAFARGPGATLTAISSQQKGCGAANVVSGLTVELTSESGLCEYSYTVSNADSDASAAIYVLTSNMASPVLPPLSQTLMLGTGSAVYNLATLLGSDWPAGYSLDASSLKVQGGTEQGTVTASGNELTYTPPNTPDWNRIVFILKHPGRPDEDVLGTLFITISEASNQPPTIGEVKYDYKAQTGNAVTAQHAVTMDLATLPNLNIVDPEGEAWQLIEVQSYSASVVPVAPNSVTNKQFTFTANTLGEHIVSYIVGDHRAGFATGLIKVVVGPDERPKTWGDIIMGAVTYRATPLYSEVVNKGVLAEEVWDDGVKNTIGAVTAVSASSYCSKGSHLATRRELDILRNTPAKEQERSKYPVQRDYIVSNGAEYLTYNLKTGVTAPYTAGSQYVICVTETPINVVSWGLGPGADSSSIASQLTDVRAITANVRSYAALKGDGTVVTWGDPSNGGDSGSVADQLVDVKAVFGNGKAFAALKNDGTVVTWGNVIDGGNSSAVTNQLTGVIDIIPGYLNAFAALKNDGTVVTWGKPENGGDSSSVADMLTDVSAVFGGQEFFIAQKKDGSVITWGRVPTLLGGAATDIKTIFTFKLSALALKHDGSWIGWGFDPTPLNAAGKQIVQVTSVGGFSYAALTSEGKVIIGQQVNETTSTMNDPILDPDGVVPSLTDVRRIYQTGVSAYSYAALKNDGTVATWFAGPKFVYLNADITASDSSAVSHLLTNVKTISASFAAFAALKEDGSVVTWGRSALGGDSSLVSGLLTDVKDIYSATTMFSAVKNNGVVVTWGCETRCGLSGEKGDYTNVQTIPNLKKVISNIRSTSSFAALLEPESE
ncbi:RCC1 domain-containing protein [Aeromonas veronii]